VEGVCTLVSSAAKGNQWFREDGSPVEGATAQQFTPAEDGIYYVAVSNGACYSDPSKCYRVNLTDKMNMTLELAKGWNWISSNLADSKMQEALQFVAPIADKTNKLVGVSSELTNDPKNGFVGNLKSMTPQAGYKLNMNQTASYTWSGLAVKPEETAINLKKGWNWIGFVPVSEQEISEAFSGFTPSENAVIKCEDDFSTYSSGKWIGTLEMLSPGKGYMYYTNKAATFTYPVQRVFAVNIGNETRRLPNAGAPWNYDTHKYPDNTTVIARLKVNGIEVLEGAYTVAAFCGDECRGIGKSVDGTLFITVHGTLSVDETIEFRAFDNVRDMEWIIKETVKFQGQNEGTVKKPLILTTASTTTTIETMAEAGYNVYPKPLRNRMFVNGQTENIKAIHVLSANGKKVIENAGYQSDGIDVSQLSPGVYVVAILMTDGQIAYEKVMKAKN
jgi:hypothetical protein